MLERWLSATIGFLLATWITTVLGCTPSLPIGEAASQPVTDLWIPAEDLDFGSVWASPTFAWQLHLHNSASQAIEIDEIRASCSCTEVSPKSFTIPAGETREINLTLDLVSPDGSTTTSERRFESVLMAVPRTHREDPHVWTLSGRVKTLLAVEPASVVFQDGLTAGQPYEPRSVRVRTHAPVDSVRAICDPTFASASVEKEEDSHYRVSIRPAESLPLGDFQFDVSIAASLDGSEFPGQFKIPVSGRVCDVVEIIPPTLHLGAGGQGEILRGVVAVRSRIDVPLRLRTVHVESAGTVLTVHDGPRPVEIEVDQRVDGYGCQTVVATVVADVTGRQSVRLSLPVIYYGTDIK